MYAPHVPMFHGSYLRPHYVTATPLAPAPLTLYDVASGEYDVQDILDSRLGHSRPEYLIKWLEYPVFEYTWEPVSHLANALDVLH